jgi:HlyD family secretion protein
MDLKKTMTSKKKLFIITGILAAISMVLFLALKKNGTPAEIPLAEAAFKNFEVNIDAVGQLDSVNAVTIGSELKGEVKIIYLIEEGTKVKKGDILVRFDSKPFEDNVDTLEAKVEEWKAVVDAQKQLLQLEKNQAVQEIKAAEFDLEVARLELQKIEQGDGPLELSRLESERIEKKTGYDELKGYIKDLRDLEKKGFAYPVEISQSNKKLEQLKKEYDVAKQKYETYKNFFLPTSIETARAKMERAEMLIQQTQKGVGFKIGKAIADFSKAEQELEKYKKELENERIQLEKTTILSPQDGLVVMKENFQNSEYRKPRVGDIVFRNQPILFIPDISAMMVNVLIREVELNKLRIGKKVNITVDAYPEMKLTGKVSCIGALAERRKEISAGGEKYFKVIILVKEKEELLRPGMTARIKIIIREGEKALLIPIEAIYDEKGMNYVYIPQFNGYRKQEVTVGLQNLESVEILKGLKKGERVCLLKPPSSMIVAYDEVDE